MVPHWIVGAQRLIRNGVARKGGPCRFVTTAIRPLIDPPLDAAKREVGDDPARNGRAEANSQQFEGSHGLIVSPVTAARAK